MTTLYNTIALSPSWDLDLDGSNNIAIQTGSAAIAQDVASAVLTFQGEVWFDTTQGIPYFAKVLDQSFSPSFFALLYNNAALTVPNVAAVQTAFNSLGPSRTLTGTIEVIDANGKTLNAHF
jgi:hypothetical protein